MLASCDIGDPLGSSSAFCAPIATLLTSVNPGSPQGPTCKHSFTRLTCSIPNFSSTFVSRTPSSISGLSFNNILLVANTVQWEKKRAEYDILREQRRRFEAELEKFNIQQAREKQQLDQMTQDLIGMDVSAGHQSEPTTPPEYRDQIYPSVFSRTNRYSSSSLTSPPGLNNRSSRSGSVLTSPPSEIAQTLHNHISNDTLPSKSVPGSRRGSNDRIASYNPDVIGNSQRAPVK